MMFEYMLQLLLSNDAAKMWNSLIPLITPKLQQLSCPLDRGTSTCFVYDTRSWSLGRATRKPVGVSQTEALSHDEHEVFGVFIAQWRMSCGHPDDSGSNSSVEWILWSPESGLVRLLVEWILWSPESGLVKQLVEWIMWSPESSLVRLTVEWILWSPKGLLVKKNSIVEWVLSELKNGYSNGFVEWILNDQEVDCSNGVVKRIQGWPESG